MTQQRFESALKDHTTYSQYAGDVDTSVISRTANVGAGLGESLKSKPKLHWKDFKAERYESKRDESKDIE